MNKDLESELRAALRPIAPNDELERKLIARLADPPHYAPPTPRRLGRRGSYSRVGWLSAALAASLLIAIGIQNVQERREREHGMEARRQVVEALRMTSQKLDLAYATVRSQSTSLADENPGA
jgi:hypothetical protein